MRQCDSAHAEPERDGAGFRLPVRFRNIDSRQPHDGAGLNAVPQRGTVVSRSDVPPMGSGLTGWMYARQDLHLDPNSPRVRDLGMVGRRDLFGAELDVDVEQFDDPFLDFREFISNILARLCAVQGPNLVPLVTPRENIMRMITIVVLGFFLASCAGAADTGALSLKLTELAPGTKPGSKVIVRITTVNESDQPITYYNTNLYLNYSLKVLTSAGIPVPETQFKKDLDRGSDQPGIVNLDTTGRRIPVTLKPGESSSEDLVVTELYDLSQPGQYSIQVDRTFPGIGHFTSNVITVTVTQ